MMRTRLAAGFHLLATFMIVVLAAPREASGQAPADLPEAIRALNDRFVAALNDDFSELLGHFYVPDAVLVLAGGRVFEGREAIVGEFLRPNVARIRGMRPTFSKTVAGEEVVTVVGAFAVRFAPAADTVQALLSNTWVRQPDGGWLIVVSTFELSGDAGDGMIRSGFFHSDGARLHYLDFGGEGLPVVFIPSAERTAYTYVDFAPRFTDRHRVLALTRRGSGQSEGEAVESVSNTAILARDVLALMDALGIERAVVVDRWTEIPIYLAEQHPDRLAGLVIMRGVPPQPDPFELRARDPTRLLEMVDRADASVFGGDPDESGPRREDLYVPRYLRTGEPIRVPTLMFVIESGGSRAEIEWGFRRGFADWVTRNGLSIPDPVSRAYFQQLAVDEELQAQVQEFYDAVFAPAWHAAEEAFFRAFGDHHLVRFEEEDARSHYQYRDAPELIEPHIRQFLEAVDGRERRRSTTSDPR